MNQKEFAKEIPSWRSTGSQDAANVLDPKEIRQDIGSLPSAAEIKEWLIGGADPEDYEGALEFPEAATEAQKQALLEAWGEGWATYAASYMRSDFEERAEESIFYEGANGMLDPGYYVSSSSKPNQGPFQTRAEAYKEAIRTLEETENADWTRATRG